MLSVLDFVHCYLADVVVMFGDGVFATVYLFFLQSLLHDPNPNSPANNEAAQLYRENRREYEKKVATVVQESWNDEDEDDNA